MKQEEYIKSYPAEVYTERVDADKLAEGRIYVVEPSKKENRFQRAYVCVKQIFSSGSAVALYFGIYIERAGMVVHISDPHVENYQSVASSRCANAIYREIGLMQYEEYNFFISSRSQVMNALNILGSLGYEFIDNEIRKKYRMETDYRSKNNSV